MSVYCNNCKSNFVYKCRFDKLHDHSSIKNKYCSSCNECFNDKLNEYCVKCNHKYLVDESSDKCDTCAHIDYCSICYKKHNIDFYCKLCDRCGINEPNIIHCNIHKICHESPKRKQPPLDLPLYYEKIEYPILTFVQCKRCSSCTVNDYNGYCYECINYISKKPYYCKYCNDYHSKPINKYFYCRTCNKCFKIWNIFAGWKHSFCGLNSYYFHTEGSSYDFTFSPYMQISQMTYLSQTSQHFHNG